MNERIAVVGAMALALSVGREAPAQLVSRLEAGALVATRDGVLPENALALSPAIQLQYPYGLVSARGSAWRTASNWQLAGGEAKARVISPLLFGLQAELAATASRVAYEPGARSDQLDGQVRVQMPFRHGGIWVGGGLERPLRMAVTSSVDVNGGGAWTRIGSMMLTGSITNFYFTKLASMHDSAGTSGGCGSSAQIAGGAAAAAGALQECWRQSQYRDLQGGFEWTSSLVEVNAQGGYRFGNALDVTSESRRWGSVTATYWLTGQFAAIVGHSRQPASPARGLPARSLSHFGIVLAYSPVPQRTIPVAVRSTVAGFELRDAREGERTIVIRAAGIESVEIMGDFTDWEPRTLTRYGRDHWEITLPLAPGVHELNVRLDQGKWRSPPGVPTRRDGFNGEVGVIVVE